MFSRNPEPTLSQKQEKRDVSSLRDKNRELKTKAEKLIKSINSTFGLLIEAVSDESLPENRASKWLGDLRRLHKSATTSLAQLKSSISTSIEDSKKVWLLARRAGRRSSVAGRCRW